MLENWIQLDTRAGKAEIKARLKILPEGPYLITNQFEQNGYEGMKETEVMTYHKDKLQNEIPEFTLGVVAYYFNDSRRLEKCFYHYDTSD